MKKPMKWLSLSVAVVLTMAVIRPHQASSESSTEWPVPETLVREYGPFALEEDLLQQVPPMVTVTFPSDVWLVGYKVDVVDPQGQELPHDLVCHTFLGDRIPQPTDHHSHAMSGVYSDGFTTHIEFPKGFGIPYKANQELTWMPMFNNRGTIPVSAAMRVSFQLIRTENLRHPLKRLHSTVKSVEFPDLYYVNPGKDVREVKFRFGFHGKVHVMGTHIHPYGVSIELVNLTEGKSIWTAKGTVDKDGNLISMPIYRSVEGYQVNPDDQFKIVATYNNTTVDDIDAMAGLYVFYSVD